jgi:hypothetical protein
MLWPVLKAVLRAVLRAIFEQFQGQFWGSLVPVVLQLSLLTVLWEILCAV